MSARISLTAFECTNLAEMLDGIRSTTDNLDEREVADRVYEKLMAAKGW